MLCCRTRRRERAVGHTTRWTRRVVLAAALASASFVPFGGLAWAAPLLPTAPGAWGTLAMPLDFHPNFFNYYGVDSAGNVYYSPNLSGGALRARQSHTSAPHNSSSVVIERFTPSTGVEVALPLTGMLGLLGLAVDPAGNVDTIAYDASLSRVVVARLNPVGGVSVLNSTLSPSAIATDAAGDVFVAVDTVSVSVYEIPAAGGAAILVASGLPAPIWSLAVAPNGTIYAVDPTMGTVHAIISGVVSLVPALTSSASNVAVDAAGNVFVSEPPNRVVLEQSAAGTVYSLPVAPPGPSLSQPILLAYGGSSIYMWDSATPHTLYTWATAGATAPRLTSVTSAATRQGNRYFQSVTATWTGTASAFRCTLLYGYNSPSSFTQVTSTHSCTFSTLDLGRSFGIAVVALAGATTSAPAAGFAPAPRVTLTCVRHGVTRHVGGLNPRCPAGWRQL